MAVFLGYVHTCAKAGKENVGQKLELFLTEQCVFFTGKVSQFEISLKSICNLQFASCIKNIC